MPQRSILNCSSMRSARRRFMRLNGHAVHIPRMNNRNHGLNMFDVGKTIINHPCGNGLEHLFMVIWRMVYSCFTYSIPYIDHVYTMYNMYVYIYIYTYRGIYLCCDGFISHHQILRLFGTDPNSHFPAARSSSKPDFVERLQTFWRTACDFWRPGAARSMGAV